ncbi:MAG: hypothetical protein AAGH15_14185 [Myxococcota bacterium]
MTAYHLLQAILFAGMLAVAVRRTRELLWRGARVEARPFTSALRGALRAGNAARARALAEGAGNAWLGRIARLAFEARDARLDVGALVDEEILELRHAVSRSPRQLRALASLASVAGLLGACGELLWLLGGDHGLKALQAGLVEAMATNGALLSLAMGMATASVALAARAGLAREGRTLLADGQRLAASLERLLDGEGR